MRDGLISEALAGEVSDATRAMVIQATGRGQVVALVIGSPEFQRQ